VFLCDPAHPQISSNPESTRHGVNPGTHLMNHCGEAADAGVDFNNCHCDVPFSYFHQCLQGTIQAG
ncbi:MAG: hypothetical protein LC657_09360, partial [Desulfobacteraceae bacterium]|nr:hypothetical protein [Desulfobacteraceae bacterium]